MSKTNYSFGFRLFFSSIKMLSWILPFLWFLWCHWFFHCYGFSDVIVTSLVMDSLLFPWHYIIVVIVLWMSWFYCPLHSHNTKQLFYTLLVFLFTINSPLVPLNLNNQSYFIKHKPHIKDNSFTTVPTPQVNIKVTN